MKTSCISRLLCAVTARWAEVLDRVGDEGVGVVGVQRNRVRDLVAAVPNMGFGHKGSPALVSFGVPVTIGN